MASHAVALAFHGALDHLITQRGLLSRDRSRPSNELSQSSAELKLLLQSLPSPPCFVVAHSGGLDSQVLLHLASQYLPLDTLKSVHVNHQLQADSFAWQLFCTQQAQALGIKSVSASVELASTSEASARDARYQALEKHLSEGDILLTAHHLNDQAETLMFRWLRASGVAGLVGIPQVRSLSVGSVFRPLLGVTRDQLEDYATYHGLEWVNDPSNAYDDYDRNYLRNQVLPLIARRWPRFAQQWQQSASHIEQAHVSLNYYLDQALLKFQLSPRILDLKVLDGVPSEVQRSLLYRWLAVQQVPVSSSTIETLMTDVVNAELDKQPVLNLCQWSLRRYQSRLYVIDRERALTDVVERFDGLQLGRFNLGDGVFTVTDINGGLRPDSGLYVVRRQGGEVIKMPNGQTKKVKKLLQEKKIPAWLRDAWPLVMHENEVVAVPGVGIAADWYVENHGWQLSWVSSSLSDGEYFAIL